MPGGFYNRTMLENKSALGDWVSAGWLRETCFGEEMQILRCARITLARASSSLGRCWLALFVLVPAKAGRPALGDTNRGRWVFQPAEQHG